MQWRWLIFLYSTCRFNSWNQKTFSRSIPSYFCSSISHWFCTSLWFRIKISLHKLQFENWYMVAIIYSIIGYQTRWISSQSAAVAVSLGTRYASTKVLDVNCCLLLSLAARWLAFLFPLSSSIFPSALPPSFLFKRVSRELRNFAPFLALGNVDIYVRPY